MKFVLISSYKMLRKLQLEVLKYLVNNRIFELKKFSAYFLSTYYMMVLILIYLI